MDSNEDYLYGDPNKIMHYMDFQKNPVPDDSKYVPDLVPGVLQTIGIN